MIKELGMSDVSMLVGLPWAEKPELDGLGQYRCYSLAREALLRMGVSIPADQAGLLAREGELFIRLAAGEAARRGDVLIMKGGGADQGGQHVGVCLDARLFIHATRTSGVAVGSVLRFQALGQVLWIARPVGLAPRCVDPEVRP